MLKQHLHGIAMDGTFIADPAKLRVLKLSKRFVKCDEEFDRSSLSSPFVLDSAWKKLLPGEPLSVDSVEYRPWPIGLLDASCPL